MAEGAGETVTGSGVRLFLAPLSFFMVVGHCLFLTYFAAFIKAVSPLVSIIGQKFPLLAVDVECSQVSFTDILEPELWPASCANSMSQLAIEEFPRDSIGVHPVNMPEPSESALRENRLDGGL